MKFSYLLKSTVFLVIIGFIACNSFPYGKTNRAYKKQTKFLSKQLQLNPDFQTADYLSNADKWVGTTNFDLRKPNFVVIHHTAQNSCDQTLRTFTMVKTKVSAHYVICKDGTVHHMLNNYMRAWHGGISKWGNNSDLNSSSIGIELDNNGFEQFDSAQIKSLLLLLSYLKDTYAIPQANFIGHADIAPKRKVDPNINFPWPLLAVNGFGTWFNPDSSIKLPMTIDVPYALAVIGYDIKDTTAALMAFKRHFRQDSTPIITEADKSVLAQMLLYKFKK